MPPGTTSTRRSSTSAPTFSSRSVREYDANHFTYAELEENEVDLVKLEGWLEKIRARDVLGARKLGATVEALGQCAHVLEEYAARVYAEEGEGPSHSERGETPDNVQGKFRFASPWRHVKETTDS